MSSVIQLTDVSKVFKPGIGRTSLLGVLKSVVGKGQPSPLHYSLRNVSLEIKDGERVGLIGNNGAGKTTLLKLIAGLYQQTSGQIRVNGRITFMAGFGVGMLDEMSVVDNVYLYAAIYGVDRGIVRANLDEIISWAGLDDFRQAKFKHLSSGMKVRLAFSTTRYFDADIYLLDEALSAGDQSFRKKCEQVFVEYREKSRTMLTSSHNMTFIEKHCEKTIWVEHGKIMAFDETADVVARYVAGSGTEAGDQK